MLLGKDIAMKSSDDEIGLVLGSTFSPTHLFLFIRPKYYFKIKKTEYVLQHCDSTKFIVTLRCTEINHQITLTMIIIISSINVVTVVIITYCILFIQISSFRCNYFYNAPYHHHHLYHTIIHHQQYQYDTYHQSHQYIGRYVLSMVPVPGVYMMKRRQRDMRLQQGKGSRDINKVNYNRGSRDRYNNNDDKDDYDVDDDDDESNNDSEDDDDSDDDDDDRPNPIVNTLKKFYDMIFFYGLDESDDINNNSRLLNLQNTEGYRRKRNSISKGNPFLTTSEKLGLYLIQSGEIDKLKRKMNSDDNFININMNNNNNGDVIEDDDYDLGDIDFTDVVDGNSLTTMSYDPKSTESLQEYIIKLRNYIEESSNQLQVIRVTLALLEEENDDNRVENRKNNRLEEEIMVLNKDMQQLVVKINNAKIELITVSAFLDDASN